MKYFSTFSGIGGFEIGIHNAYRETLRRKQADKTGNGEEGQGLVTSSGQNISSSNGRPSASFADGINEGPLCVGYSEIDKYASSVYEYHFKGAKNYGDITKINAKELPDFDCLVGGFPCQAFSVAGRRKGFEDTRGTLFFDLARILQTKQPRLFLFENVKGLLSHDDGNTFKTIIATIDELGYDCQWQVLNSKDFGVPQNRERVIIVGHLRGTPRPEVFPIGSDDETDIATKSPQIANTLTANYFKGPAANRPLIKGDSTDTEREPRGKEAAPRIRKLTPLECERLQAFPDNWTKYGNDDELISDTQRYKMCGNAVTTYVIQAVFERILKPQKEQE